MATIGNICVLIIGLIAFERINCVSVPENEATEEIADPILMESRDKFQGDIVLTTEQEVAILALNDIERSSPPSNTGLLSATRRWPKSFGKVLVPVSINASTGFTIKDRLTIWQGLRIIERKTCVRFVPRTYEEDYVDIINSSGCWSYLGRLGGRQPLSLRKGGCIQSGTVVHEFNHVLGYDHMQNRDDRDSYVDIRLENVDPSMAHNFNKVGSAFGNFGTSYEYMSVMHYNRRAFSTNGKDTIVPHDISFIDKIGSRVFTAGDATRVNNMYQCNK